MAAAGVEIAPPAGPRNQSAPAPQAMAARQGEHGGWAAFLRSFQSGELSFPPENDLEPQARSGNAFTPGSWGFAEPRLQKADANQNPASPAKPLNAQGKGANGIERNSRPSAGAPVSASAPVQARGPLQPADDSIGAGRSSAKAGESEHLSGDSKKPEAASASPGLAAVNIFSAAPLLSFIPLAASKIRTLTDSEPSSSFPIEAGNSPQPRSALHGGYAFPRAGSALATIIPATTIPAKAIPDGGAGARTSDVASPSATGAEHPLLVKVAPNIESSLLTSSVFVEPETDAEAAERSTEFSAGPIHEEALAAAKPAARAAGFLPPARAGSVSAPAKPGEVATLLPPKAETAGSSSASSNDAPAPLEISASREAAKAKLHAAGEGIAGAAPTRPLAVAATSGVPGESFLARVSGGAPQAAPAPAPAHGGMAPISAPHETFDALDAGVSGAAPTWVHAGATHAEAGFEDPALGWVGVRADLGGGGVHASLVPGSADAALALGGHLAGLNAYLAEHRSGVAGVTLAAPESRAPDAGLGQGGAAHQGFAEQAGSGRESGSHPRSSMPEGAPIDAMSGSVPVKTSTGAMENHGAFWMERGAGRHISVLA